MSNPGRVVLTLARLYYQPYNREPWPVMKIRLTDMERVVRRRYLLQNSALEIYCKESCSTKYLFLALDSTSLCDELFKRLEPKSKPNTGLDVATLQWQHGILSNYDYLLFLNRYSVLSSYYWYCDAPYFFFKLKFCALALQTEVLTTLPNTLSSHGLLKTSQAPI